ncbi:unnamed protein product [Protopolystoma xenopodis]|uniref:Uncharacterized protein n=1 Tax=Protopolystoma xenopodis TaxID=117903 RepID=A0A448XMN1_9PLAT|nr:unnamed protein product [Protopolystoma xenopodis]
MFSGHDTVLGLRLQLRVANNHFAADIPACVSGASFVVVRLDNSLPPASPSLVLFTLTKMATLSSRQRASIRFEESCFSYAASRCDSREPTAFAYSLSSRPEPGLHENRRIIASSSPLVFTFNEGVASNEGCQTH